MTPNSGTPKRRFEIVSFCLSIGGKHRLGIGLASLISALILLTGQFSPTGSAAAADDLVSALILLAKPLGTHGTTARGDNPPIKLAQTITVTTAAPATAAYNSQFEVAATASSGLPVEITTSGACSGSGRGTVKIEMTGTSGLCSVYFNQAGDANYLAADETVNDTNATKANQTISATAAFGSVFSVTAASNTGLPVTITTSGACSGNGTDNARIALISGSGTCNIHYNQAGDADHNPAPEETHTFVATKAHQVIMLMSMLPSKVPYANRFEVAATSSSKLPVVISTSGVCAGSGHGSAAITMTSGAGTCTLHFNQEGDTNFLAAPEVTGTIPAEKAILTVTPNPPTPVRQYGENNPPLAPKYAGFAPGDHASDLAEEPTCSTTAGPNSPPGQYPIVCIGGTASNYSFNYDNSTMLTVTAGAISIGFNSDNPASMKANARGKLTTGLKLIITLREKILDPVGYSASTGDLNSADLSVTLSPLSARGGIALHCKSSPVKVIGYEAVKSFTCTTNRSLAVDVYEVTAQATGNYIGIAYDSFTVYDPKRNVANGGGWFDWPGSEDKTHFGFVIQADKKNPDDQGHLLVVRHHPDGTTSRLKSNTMTGLVIQNNAVIGCGNVTFNGSAEYMAWDTSLNGGRGSYASSRGQPFMAYAEDCNQPGDGKDHFLIRSVGDLQMSSDVYVNKVQIEEKQGHIVIPHGIAKAR